MAVVVLGRHLDIGYGDTAAYVEQARLRRFEETNQQVSALPFDHSSPWRIDFTYADIDNRTQPAPGPAGGPGAGRIPGARST